MSYASTILGLSLPGMIPTSGGSSGMLLFVAFFCITSSAIYEFCELLASNAREATVLPIY
jgi:hypothetical protein